MPSISLNLDLKHGKGNNMKYIDTEKLKAKIESISLIPQTSSDYNDGRDDMKMMILDIIDSLQQEQPEVDLEKEIQKEIETRWYGEYLFTEKFKESAKHFFELGLKAQKGNEL